MTQQEEMVKKVAIRHAQHIVGGYENDLEDGNIECMPATEELVNEVYKEIMNNPTLIARGGTIGLKKEVRFLGKSKIEELARWAVEKQNQ